MEQERFTFKCLLCGAAGEAKTKEQAEMRKAHHLENHRASGG